jgi:hypothetical protein
MRVTHRPYGLHTLTGCAEAPRVAADLAGCALSLDLIEYLAAPLVAVEAEVCH